MSPLAYLHGDPGRLPFVGHFRAARTAGNTTVSAAGRVRSRGNVVNAFQAARLIENAIESTPLEEGANRHDALAAIWESIHRIDGCDLGSDNGEDLVILFAVSDAEGTGISGMGLGGVWALTELSIEPLVQGNHPLLSGPGRPDRLAGVLTLDDQANTIVGVPYDHPNPSPARENWQKRCGVNP